MLKIVLFLFFDLPPTPSKEGELCTKEFGAFY
jgi:hypothetical protein